MFKNNVYLLAYHKQYLRCYGLILQSKVDIRLCVHIKDIMTRSLRRNIFTSEEDYLFSDGR